VVFTTVDKRFDREDGGNWLQEVYSITIIYDFILTFPLCLKDISNFTPRQINLFLASAGQNYGPY